jgi:hypothetical protein
MQVIAFTGERESGKSTATSMLVEQGFKDAKFADPLKNMLRAFYATCGVDSATTEEKLEGSLKEVPCEWLQGQTPRYAMQTLGTEWRNLIGTDLWSDILVKRARRGDFGDRIAISDYRFPEHEGAALASLGGEAYRISRPNRKTDEAASHVSETAMSRIPVKATIENVGTLDDLRAKVRALISKDYDEETGLGYYDVSQ